LRGSEYGSSAAAERIPLSLVLTDATLGKNKLAVGKSSHFSYSIGCMKVRKCLCILIALLFFLVNKFIKEDQLPHLLFYVPPGTGKTSTILACAKQLYSSNQINSMVCIFFASIIF
jgi:Holliday junction resolvasome RuvABC ATP-dependent DNA helicase subunit